MNQRTIVLASTILILAIGLLILNPSMLTTAQGQMYDKHPKKSSDVNIQKLKCVNSNMNVNGIDIIQIPQDGTNTANELQANDQENDLHAANDNGLRDRINFDRNLVNVCVNVNQNEQIKLTPPTTATLTVNKEIFGCDNIDSSFMLCQTLQNGSPSWIPCTDPAISGTAFCQHVPANLFDIEILDNQNTQIQQFEGSAQGTTIENLQPGTYTVNEIKHESRINQLGVNAAIQQACINAGFDDGGVLEIIEAPFTEITYQICIEYEDEQGNNCSTVALAAGEEKTCTVKNYIRFSDLD